MNTIGKPERATQDRIIALFRDELGYRFLGGWTDRSNSQVEESLRERGNLSNAEAQAATGLDAATICTHLQALVSAGRARTEGQRRGMRYVAVYVK